MTQKHQRDASYAPVLPAGNQKQRTRHVANGSALHGYRQGRCSSFSRETTFNRANRTSAVNRTGRDSRPQSNDCSAVTV
ncbi:MAG: hypothetical protein B7Z55_03815 [Planctomycetales bacterium 12-60-4]|nr:MAG: hypothetical protein B7Z55_03815 [Planctomycetales bacterium 12-60-4]